MAPDNTTTTTTTASANTPSVDVNGASAPGASASQAAAVAAPDSTAAASSAPNTESLPLSATSGQIAAAQAPYQANMAAAGAKIQQLSQPTPPAPPAPHAKLLAMVNGLALGLDSFAKAAATHGREGGVEEVEQVRASEQAQQQQKAAAAQALKDKQLQNQITLFDTNQKLAQNAYFMARLPFEMEKQDVELDSAKFGVQKNKADFALQYGMQPNELTAAMSSPTPIGQGGAANKIFTTRADQVLGGASKILGPNDPYYQNLARTLSDPKSTVGDVVRATQQVESQKKYQDEAVDRKIKTDAAWASSPIGKLSDPKALADPGAQAAIGAVITNPNTSPEDRVYAQNVLLPAANVAQQNAENIKAHDLLVASQIDQGNPNDMGRLLATNQVTLADLKTRKTTPLFIQQSIDAAQGYAKANNLPEFNAAERTQQERAAGSEANVQFFRNTDSLLVKNGTLDQLANAYKNVANQKIPAINNLENLRKAALGDGPLAALYAAQVGVIDDYAKVMAGSGGSDNARETALKIINLAASPAMQAAAIAQMRLQIESQRNGQIGKNPYLQLMYPDPATRQETPNVSGTQNAQPTSGMDVSLAEARKLPAMKGLTDDQIRGAIQAQGHRVTD
jgi:hypothetical protein